MVWVVPIVSFFVTNAAAGQDESGLLIQSTHRTIEKVKMESAHETMEETEMDIDRMEFAHCPPYSLGRPAINYDLTKAETVKALKYGMSVGPDGQDECPKGYVRLTDWSECAGLNGVVLNRGAHEDMTIDSSHGSSKPDCAASFTKSHGCFVNEDGAQYFTKSDCSSSRGKVGNFPICKKLEDIGCAGYVKRVDLGTAGDYAILSKAGVTTTGETFVMGDIGTSPITGAALTGFSLKIDSSGEFATSIKGGASSARVTGRVWAADFSGPTPTKMTTAISDMQTAFTDAAGRSIPDHLDLGAGSVTDLTLSPGLYKWGTSVGFTKSLTFHGTHDDVWILQIADSLNVENGAQIHLTGGAKAENIFWQISGSTTFGTKSHVEGVFLCATAIVFKTGSSMNGAALAQTAVNLDNATIQLPP